MGYIEQIACTSCGKSWELRTGCGMMHGQLENVLHMFPAEIIADIKETVGEQRFSYYDFKYKAAVCDTCKNVVSVPVLELPGVSKSYAGECPECKNALPKMLPADIQNCPRCGSEALLKGTIGLWD